MFNVNLASAKRGKEVNFGLEEEVVVLPLETSVRLLLDLENDVAWFAAW